MLDQNYTCWTDGRSMAGDRPLLPSSSDSGRPLGPKALPNIRPPQQGQVPTGPFSTPAVGASAAASAMTLGTSIHDAYKAKNPPPFPVSSNEQLKALAEPDRAKWVAWFQASPAVSNYLDTRKALTESAAEYLHWYADAVREQLIKKAYTDYKAKFFPQIANAKQKLYPEMEVVLEKLEKEIEDCTKNVAIAWQKIAGGPTPYDLTKGRSIKVGQPDNPYWGLGYWQVGNTATSWEAVSAASGSDTLAIQKGLVPAAQFNLPALTLPPCGPLKEKTVSFFFGANPKVWDTSGMGPRLLKFVEFLANKPDTQWGFRYNSKTQTWYGPAVYKRLADWMAANLMDPLKAIAFAQVFANKGSTPYSISWVNDQLKFADISIESLKPGIEERQKKVEAANKVSLTALSAIPDGFERGMAAILGDQPSLLILSIVQAGIGKNLAEVAAQDIGSNWTLVQLSAYGAELQIASKGDIKEGVYFVVSVATNQASQVSQTVAGGQIGESNKQAGDAAGNLKRITDSAADTGVQTVTAEQLAAAEKAKKEAEEAAKKAAEEKAKQDAIIKAIEEASKKDYNYQTVTPVINKAAPEKVPLAGGEVVIEGLFFASNAVVAIGTTEVPATYVSPSQLKMTAPAASGPGAVDLTVTNPGETVTLQDGTTYQKKPASATLAKAFTYESPPAESAGSPLPLLALAIGAVALLRG